MCSMQKIPALKHPEILTNSNDRHSQLLSQVDNTGITILLQLIQDILVSLICTFHFIKNFC